MVLSISTYWSLKGGRGDAELYFNLQQLAESRDFIHFGVKQQDDVFNSYILWQIWELEPQTTIPQCGWDLDPQNITCWIHGQF